MPYEFHLGNTSCLTLPHMYICSGRCTTVVWIKTIQNCLPLVLCMVLLRENRGLIRYEHYILFRRQRWSSAACTYKFQPNGKTAHCWPQIANLSTLLCSAHIRKTPQTAFVWPVTPITCCLSRSRKKTQNNLSLHETHKKISSVSISLICESVTWVYFRAMSFLSDS